MTPHETAERIVDYLLGMDFRTKETKNAYEYVELALTQAHEEGRKNGMQECVDIALSHQYSVAGSTTIEANLIHDSACRCVAEEISEKLKELK